MKLVKHFSGSHQIGGTGHRKDNDGVVIAQTMWHQWPSDDGFQGVRDGTGNAKAQQ